MKTTKCAFNETTLRSQNLSPVLASWQKWVLNKNGSCSITQPTLFSTKGLEKSLCDCTGTIFVQCENPIFFDDETLEQQ